MSAWIREILDVSYPLTVYNNKQQTMSIKIQMECVLMGKNDAFSYLCPKMPFTSLYDGSWAGIVSFFVLGKILYLLY